MGPVLAGTVDILDDINVACRFCGGILYQFLIKFLPGEHLLDPIRSVSLIGYTRDS